MGHASSHGWDVASPAKPSPEPHVTLTSWNAGSAPADIEAFVQDVTQPDSKHFVPPDARVAVFDNDGTLWPERPMPIELGFILEHLAQMASEDAKLRDVQPFKAAYSRDYGWLGEVVTRHYEGDNTGVKTLVAGMLRGFAGMSVDAYQSAAASYLRAGRHPTLGRPLTRCAYAPMVELLRYLEAHGFSVYIASAGDRDFMRVITPEMYGVPAERVIGSSSALSYTENGGKASLAYLATPEVFDDGPAKPVRIWSRTGRRPILTCGNSNGDIQMLKFAAGGSGPSLGMLVLHDDSERDAKYVAGAEQALELARANHWTIVSVKTDWKVVFE